MFDELYARLILVALSREHEVKRHME